MQKLYKFLIPFLIVVVSILGLISAILAVNYLQLKAVAPKTIEKTESWNIHKIEPSGELYDVALKSSTGRIRNYTQLNSFGLSNNGQLLAFYKEKQLGFVKLDLDEVSKVNIALESIRVGSGESIYWDASNEYFSLTLLDLLTNKTYIALSSIIATETQLINSNITFTTTSIEPAIFSPITNKIIVRTYKNEDAEYPKEDGSMPFLIDLPVYLTIYGFEGQELNSIQVSDYASNQYISYGFDAKGRAKYFITTNPIDNYIPQEKYTKIQI